MGARNRVGIGLWLPRLAGRYYNSDPTWFLGNIDCSKIPAGNSLVILKTWSEFGKKLKITTKACFFVSVQQYMKIFPLCGRKDLMLKLINPAGYWRIQTPHPSPKKQHVG